MEFGIVKYAVVIMKREGEETTEEVELPTQERIRTFEGKRNLHVSENMGRGHKKKQRRKKKRSTPEKPENLSKINSTAEITFKK